MASIYKRGKDWYLDYQTNKKRHRYKVFGNYTDAKRALDAVNNLSKHYREDKLGCVCESCLELKKEVYVLKLEVFRLETALSNLRETRAKKQSANARTARFSTFQRDMLDDISDFT